MKTFTTNSREETRNLGKSFATSLKPGSIVGLFGNLGTGKTQFVMGICEGLGVQTHVGSPTFTIINEYQLPVGRVAHIDLYRINTPAEAAALGFEEYFDDQTICLIEWADKVLPILPQDRYDVEITYGAKDTEREIVIIDSGEIRL